MPPDPPVSSRHDRQPRRRWLRHAVIGVVTCGTVLAIFVGTQPSAARWLAFRSAEQFYALTSNPAACDFGPTPQNGLTDSQVAAKLEAETGHQWLVTVSKESQSADDADRYVFGHEDPSKPGAIAFRTATDDLMPKSFDVFEVARRTRNLTRHAADINFGDIWMCLDGARNGRGLQCYHFAKIFGGVCSSRGHTCRLVSLSIRGDHFDHATSELYVPALRRWILIDTDFEVAYRRKNEWLHAVEIQRAWEQIRDECHRLEQAGKLPESPAERQQWVRQKTGVEVVRFGSAEPQLWDARCNTSITGMNLELFEYVFLAIRNDELSHDYPRGHPIRTVQICFRADRSDDFIEICPEARYAAPHRVYAPIGRTKIVVHRVDAEILGLRFGTSTPMFDRFEVSVNEGPFEWIAATEEYEWRLATNKNRLDVRTRNSSGIEGEAATISVERAVKSEQ